MMKIKKIMIVELRRTLIASIVIFSSLLSGCNIGELEYHNRPDLAPISTYYLGGLDGGVWVDTFRVDSTKLIYHVYNESGKLIDTCEIIANNSFLLSQEARKIIAYDGKKLISSN